MTIADRIRLDIETRIASGEWLPGHRIPYEHELVRQYGCARATVGKAITALVRAGLVERRRKAGSFVAQPHVHAAILDIPDIGAAIAERTGSYRFELLGSRFGSGKAEPGEFKPKTRLLILAGVHHGSSGPFAHEARAINIDAVPLAATADFTREAPSAWLLGHVPWSEARHRISAVGATAEIARHLDLPRGAACLKVERWTWREKVPITYVSQIFRGDRYDLVASFTPQGR